jgi:hypothetical protein
MSEQQRLSVRLAELEEVLARDGGSAAEGALKAQAAAGFERGTVMVIKS